MTQTAPPGVPQTFTGNDSAEALWTAPTVYRTDLFAGRVAIVSGGGSGIGRATALLLAKLGAKVAICGRTPEKLDRVSAFAQAKGAVLISQVTDVREPVQINALFERVGAELGAPDILINNAGGQYPQAAIDFAPKGWSAVVNNNLNGTWFMMQRAAQGWRDAARPGVIVNIVAVTERGLPGVAHTIAARAGVVGLTRTVAIEWAPLSIRINCVAPGLTATEGLAVYPPEAHAEFARANPMRRPGTATEIAEACVYLCAPSGSFITGEVLTVDGGGKLWGELWTAGRPEYFRH
jgi:citronellol/citronellal dehydrogenase